MRGCEEAVAVPPAYTNIHVRTSLYKDQYFAYTFEQENLGPPAPRPLTQPDTTTSRDLNGIFERTISLVEALPKFLPRPTSLSDPQIAYLGGQCEKLR